MFVTLTARIDKGNHQIICTYHVNFSSYNLTQSIFEVDKHGDILLPDLQSNDKGFSNVNKRYETPSITR